MEHIMVQIMSQLTRLTEAEKKSIVDSFPIRNYEKDHRLLKAGQVAADAYFVVQGLIREYELVDGEEKTTAFYAENDSAIDWHSQSQSVPSAKFFECVESTTVAIINAAQERKLYQMHPRFERYCREGMEQMIGAKHNALSQYILLNPKERYLKLMEERPSLLMRVPQYHIASYLGIKPETLSRIRKKLSSKT